MSTEADLPDVMEDEDLDDLPPVERAIQLELRRRGLDLELESQTGEAREFADLRVARAEQALANVPEELERERAITTIVDELAEVLRNHVQTFEEAQEDDDGV